MSESRVICLVCRKGQVRTDQDAILNGNLYALTKTMCPHCHAERNAIVTSNVNKLKNAIASSEKSSEKGLERRIREVIG